MSMLKQWLLSTVGIAAICTAVTLGMQTEAQACDPTDCDNGCNASATCDGGCFTKAKGCGTCNGCFDSDCSASFYCECREEAAECND